MKVLKGDLVERRFEIPPAGREGVMETGMREIARRVFAEEKVGYMSDELGVHEISNPSPTEYAVSLHRKFNERLVLLCRIANWRSVHAAPCCDPGMPRV